MMELMTSAVRLQRPMARSSSWLLVFDGVSGTAWFYHKCVVRRGIESRENAASAAVALRLGFAVAGPPQAAVPTWVVATYQSGGCDLGDAGRIDGDFRRGVSALMGAVLF